MIRLFSGCVENDVPEKALDLFEEMTEAPDQVILTIVFSACAALENKRAVELGNTLLDKLPKNKDRHLILVTAAITMLMKFGQVKQAEDLFHSLSDKDAIIHSTMIKGQLL